VLNKSSKQLLLILYEALEYFIKAISVTKKFIDRYPTQKNRNKKNFMKVYFVKIKRNSNKKIYIKKKIFSDIE
jgi:hypothetical protein